MVWKPNVFHSPVSNEPSAIAEATVGISHVMPSALVWLLPLNHPAARKAIPFGLLSARAAPAASSAASTATTSIPRPTIRMSLLLTPSTPTPATSEMAHDLLARELHERRSADLLETHEADAPPGRLLVGPHGERERRGREARRYIGRQARPLEERHQAPGGLRPAAAERHRHADGRAHADRHRLAVPQLLVARERLEGVADRVSEVEHGAAAVDLLLVLGHHARLVAHARGDHRDDHLALEADHALEPLLELGEQARVADRRRLDHLGHPGQELAPRQRPERLDVGQHQARLMEGADQVLAEHVVDTGLAAD